MESSGQPPLEAWRGEGEGLAPHSTGLEQNTLPPGLGEEAGEMNQSVCWVVSCRAAFRSGFFMLTVSDANCCVTSGPCGRGKKCGLWRQPSW